MTSWFELVVEIDYYKVETQSNPKLESQGELQKT